jgi:hypothetical protein
MTEPLADIARRLEAHEAALRGLLDRLGATPQQVADLDLAVAADLRAYLDNGEPRAATADTPDDRGGDGRAGPPRALVAPPLGEVGSDHYVIDRADDDGADPEPDGTPSARGAQRQPKNRRTS